MELLNNITQEIEAERIVVIKKETIAITENILPASSVEVEDIC